MKKILSFIITIALPITLSSCGRKIENTAIPSKITSDSVSFLPSIATFDNLSNKKLGWGMGKQVDSDNRPTECTAKNKIYGKYNAEFIKPKDQNVYFTFDLGYENGNTSRILDILRDKKANGTFFVTYDYAKKNHPIITRMITEGHTIANHSYKHLSMPVLSPSETTDEIMQLHDYIREEFGQTMTLFRPPMGEFSERALAIVKSLDYKTVFWSVAYEDWEVDNQPDPKSSREKLKKLIHPGAIYLFHTVSTTNAEILGDVIDDITASGFSIAKYS